MTLRSLLTRFGCLVAALAAAPAFCQEAVPLAERFDPADPYRVDLRVRLSGRLAVPLEAGKPPAVVPMTGTSTLVYDERTLPADDPRTGKTVRAYREVEFARAVGDKDQKAEVRPAVRRMVVLRSEAGKKVPFSPDGPLTWGEIDVVRTDLFAPALVPGLLPARPVRPGDRWPASAAAVTELTDFNTTDEGGLTVEFVSVVTLQNRRFAKLGVAGVVKGVTDDGPSRQRLDGTGYFDLAANRLTYLNLKGVHELLGADGKTTGRIDGTFVMTRGPAGREFDLSELALRRLDLTPTPENTQLLYDNPDLGVTFLYPRRWRVGAVQGRQLTVEESTGGGILVSLEPAASLPTADQYATETKDYLRQQKWALLGSEAVRRVSDKPVRVDRFALDAEVNKERVRLEYALVAGPDGGATVAARLPWAGRDELGRDVDRILKTLAVTKRIEK